MTTLSGDVGAEFRFKTNMTKSKRLVQVYVTYTACVGDRGAGRAAVRLDPLGQGWALGSAPPTPRLWAAAPTHWGWRRRRR